MKKQNKILPSEWKEFFLGDVSYGSFSKGKGISRSEVLSKGFPCVRYGEIYTSHDFIVKKVKSYINSESSKNSNEIFNGDLLFAGSGETLEDIGKCVAYTFDDKAYAGGDIVIYRCNKSKLSNVYLSYFLNTEGRKQLNKLGQGNSVVHIYSSSLKKVKIPLPPIEEQERIAEVLGCADSVIELTVSKISKLKLQKKSLMQKLLTPKPHWTEKQLCEICEISKGKQLNRLDLIDNGKYPSMSGGITPSGYTNNWNTEGNTIIISEGGNSCGYVNYLLDKFWCGGHCYALKDIKADKSFFFQILKHNERKIMSLRVGSGLPNIQKSTLSKYKISVPPLKEQEEIAEVLKTQDAVISLNEQKLQNLKLQKKSLMQKLLTGEWRI